MRTLQRKDGQKGVLLIEVMVSILIFSVAILGLVGLQARAIGFSTEAEDRNRAALLANDMVTAMWDKQTVDADQLGGEIAAWRSRVQAALPPYDTSVTATVGNVGNDGTVAIEITWKPVGGDSPTHNYLTKVAMP